MLLPLLVVLAAAPIDVIVVHAPKPDQEKVGLDTFNRLLQGATLVDASAIDGALFVYQGLLPFNDFESYTAKPPAIWPEPLRPVWTAGVAHCLSVVGPPPWRDQASAAMACSTRLSEVLWLKYLTFVGAERAYELHVRAQNDKSKVSIRGVTYETRGSRVRRIVEEVEPARLPFAVDFIVQRLKKGEGDLASREIYDEVATTPTADPFAGQKADVSAVKLKSTCAALPGKLDITPVNSVATAVSGRWAASVPAGAQTRRCSIQLTESEDALMGQKMTVVAAVLTCGADVARAEAARDMPAMPRPGVDLLSSKLVTGLAAAICGH